MVRALHQSMQRLGFWEINVVNFGVASMRLSVEGRAVDFHPEVTH